jgi:hypothetical protein
MEFEKLFNLKIIKYTTIFMVILSTIIVLIGNVTQVLAEHQGESLRILYIRDWVFFKDEFKLSILYYLSVPLAFINGAIYFTVATKITAITKARTEKSNLRNMLYSTAMYLGIGHLFEGFYLTFKSDFIGAYEVIGQFYITLDTLAMVIFIAIAFSIFLAEDIIKKPGIAIVTYIFCMAAYILAFIMMLLYGLNPQAFSVGVIITIGLTAIISLIGISIVIRIIHISHRVEKERKALLFIAIQLGLLILSTFLLIGCGLTISTNILLNRILRFLRMITLGTAAVLYFPAFINPAKINIKAESQ